MIDSKQPVRPKRLNKSPPKDQSGLLMSVIRSLTLSQNTDERDREKKNLEKNFKLSDERLEDLVAIHRNDLSQILSTFRKVPQKITDSLAKLKQTKEKLAQCQSLLMCKREEVKKHWLEVMEYKHTLLMLEEIENVMTVPERVQAYIDNKHYLHATHLIVSVNTTLNEALKPIEALEEVKTDIKNMNDEIFDHIIEDIHKHLYELSTMKFLKNVKLQNLEADAFEENKNEIQNIEGYLTEDTLLNPMEDSRRFISVMIYCLSLLKKLPEATQSIREKCQKEMMAIVWRTPSILLEILPNLRLVKYKNENNDSYILRAFLDLVFEQFKVVLAMHQWILLNLVHIGKNNPVPPYDLNDIWSKAQAVVELLAVEYLDVSATGSTTRQGPATLSDLTTNINSYFSKKRTTKLTEINLFKFDCSSHALSMNAYIKEQKEALIKRGEFWNYSDSGQHQYVCEPACKNVVVIFNPTMKFIQDIEAFLSIKLGAGDQCPLHTFIVDYVKVFLNQLTNQVENTVETAIKEMENRNFTCDVDFQKEMGASKPILHSTFIIYQSLQELEELFSSLPLYANHFYGLICKILNNYKEACQNAFRGIVQHESQDKRIISATWAKDEDISRYLKSLPTWINLQNQKNNTNSSDIEESPEEVNHRNKKVSEILTSNITGDTLIPQHEILSDINKLHILGQLHESMEWLGNHVVTLAQSLPCVEKTEGLVPKKFKEVPPFLKADIENLSEIAQDFDNLADTCLLVLYLEARVHCFYYLLPLTKKEELCISLDTQEPDTEVIKLNKDLSTVEEELVNILLSRKLKCIFEGIGHLVSSIFINYVGKIHKINENGVKKMCRNVFSLQQNLATITKSREVALDRARQYYELLFQSSEEVLNSILDYGPQFQELEYTNIIKLIHRSGPNFDQYTLDQELKRLLEILSKVSVQL